MAKEGFHPLCMVWADKAILHDSTLLLSGIATQMIFSATRPKKVQVAMHASRFFLLWKECEKLLEEEPPEIALVYTKMQPSQDGLCHAIAIQLSHPMQLDENSWSFAIEKNNSSVTYEEVALFIDWLPASSCPKPVQLLFPDSVS